MGLAQIVHTGIRSFATALLLIGLPGHVRTASRDLPFTSRLQRGINLNGWFTGATAAPNRFSQNGLKLISALGFTFVRLPVDPKRLMTRGILSEDSLGDLDRALDLIPPNDLA